VTERAGAARVKTRAPRGRRRVLSDLGLSRLLPEWKGMLSPLWLRDDVVAGLTVACIAIPLSLAIALASGVAPEAGLVTAIVAGTVAALAGGTRLAVTGPAAAMAVLVASVVERHGAAGLLVVTLGCGGLQLLSGVFQLGRLVRFVPVPVVAGFTAGIGAIILIGQLPRALGLPPPESSHVLDVVTHLRGLIHQTRPEALFLTVGALALLFGLPRVMPKVPAPLVAVVLPTLVAVFAEVDVATIGTLPASLPAPSLPGIPEGWVGLVPVTLLVFALASLETLLSSTAIDKLARNQRHDPDQELVGQGLANIASSLFGGIPATGVIVRSALNVQAGAKTRRSVLIHCLVLVLAVYVFAPLLSRIPIAALAGVLLSVALRMLHPREFFALWRMSRIEAAVYGITFLVIVGVDLIAGVQAGIVAALAIAAARLGRAQTTTFAPRVDGPYRVSLSGALTFLSSSRIERLREEVREFDGSRGVVFDMSGVNAMDASGAESVAGVIDELLGRGTRVALQGLLPSGQEALRSTSHGSRVAESFAITESEVRQLIGGDAASNATHRLAAGVERFRHEATSRYRTLFQRLATGQEPHTFFITCADSRVNPNLITSTDPGELFILRNVGNLVPPYGGVSAASTMAAVEYATTVLSVRDIVVCGHSGCGAMKALVEGNIALPDVGAWLRNASGLDGRLVPAMSVNAAAELNVLQQLEHLKAYPAVAERLEKGAVRLFGWFYDVGTSELLQWNPTTRVFEAIGAHGQELTERMQAEILSQAPLDR
jgi:carbonic anhydrase